MSIGELFETIREGLRTGAFPKPDPADVAAIGPLFEGVRDIPEECNLLLDEGQAVLYGLSQEAGKGRETVDKIVSYIRVSTKKQGRSGLGLEAQRQAVSDYAKQSQAKVMREFQEVESGKRSDRPELAAALAFARRSGARLCVAKLDRLARNVAFLSRLMESGVDVVACDNPHATRFTGHILAAVAEWEAEAISKRTKEGLAQARKKGVALGSARPGHWEGREDARRRGGVKGLAKARKVISERARAEYADLLPVIQGMRSEGLSLQKIADALNADGHRTRRGKKFHSSQVRNILTRAEE